MDNIIPIEHIDHEYLDDLVESFVQFHREAEIISIQLENNPEKMDLVMALRLLFEGLLYRSYKLEVAPISESLKQAIIMLELVEGWKYYPKLATHFLLLIVDRILLLAHDLESKHGINIRITQQIHVAFQKIILAKSSDALAKGIEKAIAILEKTDEEYSEEQDNTNIELFDNETESNQPQETQNDYSNVSITSLNCILEAREYIESEINDLPIHLISSISDVATKEKESHTHFLLEICLAANFLSKASDPYDLSLAICFHDIGLATIPHILEKPGRLTQSEVEEIRKHPARGATLLKAFEDNNAAADIVYAHHERVDGSGYPLGIRGSSIPEGAKLLAIVDSFHAMVENRPYKRYAKGISRALSEIDTASDMYYEKHWVNTFKKCLRDHWLPIKSDIHTAKSA